MADKVQKQLEDLVPDLQELLSQELFSLKEVKNIIGRRRVFEFEIISPDPSISLDSYKKYIEYELELDKIIESRYRKMKKANKLKGIDTHEIISPDKSKIDSNYNGTSSKRLRVDMNHKRHIHRIFRRCLSRFISNTEVYNLYLSFCRKIKANKLFERVIMNGLSKNPNDENLWLILGSYVLKNRGIIASKNIIQRSLRIIPNNVNLILYLYQLEVKSLMEILVTYGEDKESIEESISKCYIIFEYGCENLSEEDTVKFYFSTLSIMNQMLSIEEHKEQLGDLLEKINSKMEGTNIPIIRLYKHQIRLLEHLISRNTTTEEVGPSVSTDNSTSASGRDLEKDEEDVLLKMFNECYTGATNINNTKESNKGILIPVLQFIYNTITSENTENTEAADKLTEIMIDVNPSNGEEGRLSNELNNDTDSSGDEVHVDSDKEYLIKNYCIIENVYYLCLLGSIPEYHDVKACKYTSNIANKDQLKRLKEVYLSYLTRRIEEIVKFTLELSSGDVNDVYYHLKLLVYLSELEDIKNGRSKILGKIEGILKNLTTVKGLMGVNEKLAQIILKLKADFELKKKVFMNFKSLTLNNFKFFTKRIFDSQLSLGEKIELFLIFYKHNEEYENLTIFLNKLDQLEEFIKFIKRNSKYIDSNIYNEFVIYMTEKIESKVEKMSTNDIEVSDIVNQVNTLNGWLGNKNMELNRENKQNISNLNVKLSLFNISINS